MDHIIFIIYKKSTTSQEKISAPIVDNFICPKYSVIKITRIKVLIIIINLFNCPWKNTCWFGQVTSPLLILPMTEISNPLFYDKCEYFHVIHNK